MREPTLQSLIKKHKKRIKTLRETQVGYDYPDMQAYYDWVEIAKRFLRKYFPGDESVVDFCKLSEERISRDQQEKLLSILNAFVVIPQIIKCNNKMEKEDINLNVTVNNNNSQSQNQEQSTQVQQFLDAFRDELTGQQLKELKSVIADNDLHKAKPKIMDKLMEFGGNVASNILATILTNTAIGLCL